MKTKRLFKKSLATILIFCLLGSLAAVTVGAAGIDDGALSVTDKNSKKYFGTAKSEFCTEYVSTNGDGDRFYRYENVDINGDNKTDITDLVALNNAALQNDGTDLNFDSSVDAADLAVMRRVLIGITDIQIN